MSALADREQLMEALIAANGTRRGKAAIRKELRALDRRAGSLRMAELVLETPAPFAGTYTFLLLQMSPGVGEWAAGVLLKAAGVGPWVKAGRLTDRQREALSEALAGFAERGVAAFDTRPVAKPRGLRCSRCGEGPLAEPGLCGWCDPSNGGAS